MLVARKASAVSSENWFSLLEYLADIGKNTSIGKKCMQFTTLSCFGAPTGKTGE